ncbi:9617_t:CDS:10, partial [Acaulospora morrowiae]
YKMHFTPFTLQTLLDNVSLEDTQQASSQNTVTGLLGWGNKDNRNNASSRLGWGNKENKVTVESVEAWENNLYVGTSDGHIIHYFLDDQISSENSIPNNFQVSKLFLGFGKRIVERIMLFPQICVAIILYSTLSAYALPNMDPMPLSDFPYIKGVTCFCHDISMEGKTENDGSVRICAIKKRNIHIFSIGSGWTEETTIALPDGAMTACQYGPYMCIADHQWYKLINLKEKRLENVMQYNDRNSAMGNEMFKPIITIIGDSEFLLALPANRQFISFRLEPGRGMWEPVRGTLQWQSLPRAIGVELPYVVALLRNNQVEVHNIMDQQLVQSFQLPSKFRTISTGPGIKVRVAGLMERLKLENLFSVAYDDNSTPPDEFKIGQDNFLPTVPTRLILAGSEFVMALATTPITVQVDAMLDANRVEEALELAEQAIRTATPENVHSERMASIFLFIRHEFNYIHQKSGFLYLGETLFDLSYTLFEKGKTDPRILIQFFPEMKHLVNEDKPVNIYSGVKSVASRLGSIDDIISVSIIKNYDPHIKPDIETSPATQKLRQVLTTNAKEMLQKFLTLDREQRKSSGKVLTEEDKIILKAVDNSLVHLYAESNLDNLLRSLLEGENECDLDLCRKILEEHKKLYPLSLLHIQKKEYRKALEIWKTLIDQENSEQGFTDGLQKMVNLLAKLRDQELVLEYASWVIRKNDIIGAKIFTQQDSKKPISIEPNVILKELRSVGKKGLKVYLEYLIISRKSQEKEHHTEYALLCIQDIQAEILQQEIRSKFEALTDSFIKRKGAGQTYLTFLMNQSDDTFSQSRVKLIIFLQSSTHYNAEEVLAKLNEIKILKAELAIAYGKLGEHEIALQILINDLKDYRGAEIYCLHAGRVIGIVNKSAPKKHFDKKISEEKSLFSTRRALFLNLLKVYLEMENRDEIVDIIIHLLNTQAVYLDIMEVLSLLPKYWSVEMLNEFLIRSLRQSYHEYREGQILKGLCRGENTTVNYELFQTYKEIGPLVITQNVICSLCKKHISGAEFKRLPNSDIVHVQCGVRDEHDENGNITEREGPTGVDTVDRAPSLSAN